MNLLPGMAEGLAITVSFGFLAYVALIVVPFLRHRREPSGDAEAYTWHFFVPCRDEAAVIEDTIAYLRTTFPAAHLWIVDDASVDDTAALARRHASADPHVHLIHRTLPGARTGKGPALNAAYRALLDWRTGESPRGEVDEQTVVVVVDADGRPAPECLATCAGPSLFGDRSVGAVQIEVRMARLPGGTRRARLLTRLQDIEFRAAISAIQLARCRTATVGLGGNGQFTRLSALREIATGDGPWGNALLEDFEIGVRLLLAGHRTRYSRDTHVGQEAVTHFGRLITQRTRWAQGTMQCARYLPQVWRSPHLSTLGAAEIACFLVQPWLLVAGAILYPIPGALAIWHAATDPTATVRWLATGGWLLLVLYALVGAGPLVAWGPVYRLAVEPGLPWPRAVACGMAYAAYVYAMYLAACRAFGRMIAGRHGWAKTRRARETPSRVPDAACGPALAGRLPAPEDIP